MTVTAAITVDQIAAELRRFRIPRSNEAVMQDAIGTILKRLTSGVWPEYRVGAHGRIDFFLPNERIGIEAKTQGSAADTTRQLFRYAESGHFAALVLVTCQPSHTNQPTEMAGIPVSVVLTSSQPW